ncbi:MAG: proline dehydrogenase family protein [Anaerolineales bacterium]|nr:proline dehydrogenase family protein [Anaerolineales bacterium]
MLRTPILYLSQAGWARRIVTRVGPARRMANRFVAGETAAEAVRTIQQLNALNINATLDHLGESVTSEREAERAADDYVHVLERIGAAGARSNVSLKLTQFGLDLSEDFCTANTRRVVAAAQAGDNFVRIDMEGTPHTDRTLRVLRALHAEFENVGLVVQAYLYRTATDVEALIDEGVRLRLCKGAYQEPGNLAFPKKGDVDENYDRLARRLLDAARHGPPAGHNGRFPPLAALATHDAARIEAAKAYAQQIGLGRECYEFQMLHGIRRDLQEGLAREGYAVRVYVPYGTEWYPYFMRRLAERPANLWFFLSNLVKR